MDVKKSTWPRTWRKQTHNWVVSNREGKLNTVRYEAVNAMLPNEFLKEHQKVLEMEKRMTLLTAQLKEQTGQIQKVNERLELSKSSPRLVAFNP